jgi:peptide/nickel transport system permease protein
VIAPSIAIASLTITVNLVIDNLPGRAARER